MLLRFFPLLALLAGVCGYLFPSIAKAQPAIVPLLMLVMSFMGLTLTVEDFLKIKHHRLAIVAGVVLQFSVMPVTALTIALLMGLNTEQTTGLVLVGSVAGGTASNVMTYLARGNVALSVAMTATSTLLSIVLTPLIMTLAVGSKVPVPAADMLQSLVQIILLPVAVGVALNHFARRQVKSLEPLLVAAAMLVILIIIAIVLALNANALSATIIPVAIATLLHNCSGLLFGYLGAYALRFDPAVRRTIAIEVGMQNSGLATALALKFFTPAAALPGAIFSVWLNITGALFASLSLKLSEADPAEKAGTKS